MMVDKVIINEVFDPAPLTMQHSAGPSTTIMILALKIILDGNVLDIVGFSA